MRFMVINMKIAYKERLMKQDFERIKNQLQGILTSLNTTKATKYYIRLLDNLYQELNQINYEIDKIEKGDE